MKLTSPQTIRATLLALLIASVTGCGNRQHEPQGSDSGQGSKETRASQSSTGTQTRPTGFQPGEPPTPSAGSLAIPTGLFTSGNNQSTCFLTSQGWDRFYIVVTNFPGPKTVATTNSFPNSADEVTVTVRTCNAVNGATLETGIVIFDEANPSTDKQCWTNSPACQYNSKLTINKRPIERGKYYRAVVYYKSATLTPDISNVRVDFYYP